MLQGAATRLAKADGNIADLIEMHAVEVNRCAKLCADMNERDARIQRLCEDLQKKDDLIFHQTVEQEDLVRQNAAFNATLQSEIESLRIETANTKQTIARVNEDVARALSSAEARADACQRECDEHRSAAVRLASELIQARQYGHPMEMAADVVILRQTIDNLQVAYASASPEARAMHAIASYPPNELVNMLTVIRKQIDESFHIFRRSYAGVDTASAGPVFDRFLRRIIIAAGDRELNPDTHGFFAAVIQDPSPVLFPITTDWRGVRSINQQCMLLAANDVWIRIEKGTEADAVTCIKQLFCAAIAQYTSMMDSIRGIRSGVKK